MPERPKNRPPGTPLRRIRIEEDLWAEFGHVADDLKTDRSALLRDFMKWMVRKPGARMPKRPVEGSSKTS